MTEEQRQLQGRICEMCNKRDATQWIRSARRPPAIVICDSCATLLGKGTAQPA